MALSSYRDKSPWWSTMFSGDYLDIFTRDAQQISDDVDFITDLLQLPPRSKILDLACGSGKHTMELAARGYYITGLDISKKLICDARQTLKRRGLEIGSFMVADMRKPFGKGCYDALFCFFTSFGYFSAGENERVLENMAMALQPGGKLLLDLINKDWLAANIQTVRTVQQNDITMTETVERFDIARGIFQSTWVFSRGGRETSRFKPTLKLYSFEEIKHLLEKHGFIVDKTLGDYAGSSFTTQSPRIVIAAHKKF